MCRFSILLIVCVFVLSLTPLANAGFSDGTVLGVTKVLDNGPDAERFNIVVMGDGFTAAQQDQFNNAVNVLVSSLFNYTPLDTMTDAFNVIRINVASDQSGADNPIPCDPEGTYVNTYFDATYCNGGIPRALVVNNSIVMATLGTWAPMWDQGVVIVNATQWGGTGGSVAVTSLAGGWQGIVIHELGHSAFGFADEYEYYAGCGETGHDNHSQFEPGEPNVTVRTIRQQIKWNHLILPQTPVPTTENANCAVCDPQGNPQSASTVGLYEGAHYYHCDCYRPQYSCMMRNLASFCAVCQEVIVSTLTPYLPEDVCNCPSQADFNADGLRDAVDLNEIIDAIFFNGVNIKDPDCPEYRADFDASTVIDAIDLNLMIDHLFFNGLGPCDPCDPVGSTCNTP